MKFNFEIELKSSQDCNANIWFDKIKNFLNEITEEDFFHMQITLIFKIYNDLNFDFYEINKFKKLLQNEDDDSFVFISFQVIFLFQKSNNLDLIISYSKNEKIEIEKIEFTNEKKINKIGIIFNVNENFFKNLELKDKTLYFKNANYKIGFNHLISPKNISDKIEIWDFNYSNIYYNEKTDFENFYYFFDNFSEISSKTIKNSFIIANTCEHFERLFALTTKIILKEDIKCDKIILKNFGKFYDESSTTSIYLDGFSRVNEIIFDTNINDIKDIKIQKADESLKTVEKITFKNLNIETLLIESKFMNGLNQIEIENCKMNSFFFSINEKYNYNGNFLFKCNNSTFNESLKIPFFFPLNLEGANNKINDKIEIIFDSDLKSENNMNFFNIIFNENIINKIDDKNIFFNLLKIFFKFKTKDNKTLISYLKDKFKKDFNFNKIFIDFNGSILLTQSEMNTISTFIELDKKVNENIDNILNYYKIKNIL